MSASRSGNRSNQRSARLRMFSVATWSRSIGPSVASGWWWRDRQREREGTADAFGRFDPDPPAVLLDDVARDRQAESRAARPAPEARPVDLVEPLEDPGLGGARDAHPVVGHGHDDIGCRGPGGHDDLAALHAELHGVVEEVDDDLPEAVLVAPDVPEVVFDLDVEDDSLAFCEQPQALGRVDRDPADIDEVDDTERRATLDAGKVEKLRDHLDEVARLDLDLADPIAHAGRHGITRRLSLPGQRLGQQADRGQRRPQLVGEVVDELGADLLEATQLGDIFDDHPQPA